MKALEKRGGNRGVSTIGKEILLSTVCLMFLNIQGIARADENSFCDLNRTTASVELEKLNLSLSNLSTILDSKKIELANILEEAENDPSLFEDAWYIQDEVYSLELRKTRNLEDISNYEAISAIESGRFPFNESRGIQKPCNEIRREEILHKWSRIEFFYFEAARKNESKIKEINERNEEIEELIKEDRAFLIEAAFFIFTDTGTIKVYREEAIEIAKVRLGVENAQVENVALLIHSTRRLSPECSFNFPWKIELSSQTPL
jgi:hypothetical protein